MALGTSRTRNPNPISMFPPYSLMSLCFSFFLYNWSSTGSVYVGVRLIFLWLSDQKGIRKVDSLSVSVFKHRKNNLTGTSWVICPLLRKTIGTEERYQKWHSLGTQAILGQGVSLLPEGSHRCCKLALEKVGNVSKLNTPLGH